jgi:hypothetical protein
MDQQVEPDGTVEGPEQLVGRVFNEWVADWLWYEEFEIPKPARHALQKRIAKAIRERMAEIRDPYLDELEGRVETAEMRLDNYRSNGAVNALETELGNRDLFIKWLLLEKFDGEVRLTESDLAEMQRYTLRLSNKDGNIYADVIEDDIVDEEPT